MFHIADRNFETVDDIINSIATEQDASLVGDWVRAIRDNCTQWQVTPLHVRSLVVALANHLLPEVQSLVGKILATNQGFKGLFACSTRANWIRLRHLFRQQPKMLPGCLQESKKLWEGCFLADPPIAMTETTRTMMVGQLNAVCDSARVKLDQQEELSGLELKVLKAIHSYTKASCDKAIRSVGHGLYSEAHNILTQNRDAQSVFDNPSRYDTDSAVSSRASSAQTLISADTQPMDINNNRGAALGQPQLPHSPSFIGSGFGQFAVIDGAVSTPEAKISPALAQWRGVRIMSLIGCHSLLKKAIIAPHFFRSQFNQIMSVRA